MRIGSSLVLIAIGAILKFALTTSVSGINLSTVGVILMVVGIAGLVISLVLVSTARRTDVVDHTAREDYVEPPPATTHASDRVGFEKAQRRRLAVASPVAMPAGASWMTRHGRRTPAQPRNRSRVVPQRPRPVG